MTIDRINQEKIISSSAVSFLLLCSKDDKLNVSVQNLSWIPISNYQSSKLEHVLVFNVLKSIDYTCTPSD